MWVFVSLVALVYVVYVSARFAMGSFEKRPRCLYEALKLGASRDPNAAAIVEEAGDTWVGLERRPC